MTFKYAKKLIRSLGGKLVKSVDGYHVVFGSRSYVASNLSDAVGAARSMSSKVSQYDSSKSKYAGKINPHMPRGKWVKAKIRVTKSGKIQARIGGRP